MEIFFDFELLEKDFMFSESGHLALRKIRGFVYQRIAAFKVRVNEEKGITVIKILDRKNEIDISHIENIGVYFLHFSKDLEALLKKTITQEDIEYIFSLLKEAGQGNRSSAKGLFIFA
jgi:hypothetical protein